MRNTQFEAVVALIARHILLCWVVLMGGIYVHDVVANADGAVSWSGKR